MAATSLTHPLLLMRGHSVPNSYNPKTITKHSLSQSSNSPSFSSSSSSSRRRRGVSKSRVGYSYTTFKFNNKGQEGLIMMASSENVTTTTEKSGVKIQRNPPESKLTQLGVRNWPKWGCPPSKFPWTYSSKETCYLLKGKVKVYPEGSDEAVEIGAGDFVEFPKGMSCTWDVSEAVDKHYNFE